MILIEHETYIATYFSTTIYKSKLILHFLYPLAWD